VRTLVRSVGENEPLRTRRDGDRFDALERSRDGAARHADEFLLAAVKQASLKAARIRG
jgi:hypothetical protein